jgi:hypothetical protein
MQAEVRLVYAALSGQDVSLAAPLSVPEPQFPRPGPISEATAARQQLTTARGVVASGMPSPLRAAWASLARKPVALGGAGAALLLLVVALARSCAPVASPEASAPSAANVRVAAPVPAAASVVAVEVMSAVPQVAIEQLPRERRKKLAEPRSGAAKPGPKDDPFARRR